MTSEQYAQSRDIPDIRDLGYWEAEERIRQMLRDAFAAGERNAN